MKNEPKRMIRPYSRKLTLALWGLLIVAPLVVLGLLSWPGPDEGQRWVLFALGVEITVVLTAAPLMRYMNSGWYRRYEAFRNNLDDEDEVVRDYLQCFWPRQLSQLKLQAQTGNEAASALFDSIYVDQFGRRVYIAPTLILLTATFVLAALAVQSGVDACWRGSCLSATTPTPAKTVPFAPIGGVVLPQVAVVALAGALLFVVGDMVYRVARRTLAAPDIYVYALRMAIAVPMGLAVGAVGTGTGASSLVAFGLGAFPLDALQRLIRRRTTKAIGVEAEVEAPDQLIQLDGVTVPLASALAAAGIDAIDQLVGTDPVLLSIRAELELTHVLRLVAQAVARKYLGGRAGQLNALGLGNACLIAAFVKELRSEAARLGDKEKLGDAAAKRLRDARSALMVVLPPSKSLSEVEPIPSEATVRAVFERIADDPFTQFLVKAERRQRNVNALAEQASDR
jgi:hypothetical protein